MLNLPISFLENDIKQEQMVKMESFLLSFVK